MTTHVDGAAPSVAPDDPDDDESPDGSAASCHDTGSEWVRAEMQRRMAANRATRGRHARAAAAALRQDAPPLTAAGLPRRVRPTRAAAPTRSTEPVSPGELPENYVPRHSVQTPGPAAQPAASITGPIPMVRPTVGPAPAAAVPADATPEGDGTTGTSGPAPTGAPPDGGSANAAGDPRGGPSPTPGRRRRGAGPGTPLQRDAAPTGASWTRPAPIVPPERVRRLGAPPEALGDTIAPPWGPPSASPARGVPAPPQAVPSPVSAPSTAGAPADVAPPTEATGPTDDGAALDGRPVDGTADAPAGADLAVEVPTEVPTETTGEITDEIAGGITDSPTAPHPVVAQRTTLSGRIVGVPLPRTSDHTRIPARPVAPRPATPRHIPVVGTAPPEPGSTRVRVVLSERKGVARPVRTIKEVQEGTAVGELLRRDLIRSQLRVTLRFALLTLLVLGSLPAVFAMLPVVGQARILGVGVPWVVLGVLMYPFLVGTAWRYTRVAERVEQNFADHVQD